MLNWFILEDIKSGEVRDVFVDASASQGEARERLGGIWTDVKRVICLGPHRIDPGLEIAG